MFCEVAVTNHKICFCVLDENNRKKSLNYHLSYHFIWKGSKWLCGPHSDWDILKPHFYIVKLGFTGVYIIFLISAQKHRLWVLNRIPCSNEYPQSMF